ncbi:MAG: hypothetical protein AAGK14_01770 [Verrucomicrobiota bacterium]
MYRRRLLGFALLPGLISPLCAQDQPPARFTVEQYDAIRAAIVEAAEDFGTELLELAPEFPQIDPTKAAALFTSTGDQNRLFKLKHAQLSAADHGSLDDLNAQLAKKARLPETEPGMIVASVSYANRVEIVKNKPDAPERVAVRDTRMDVAPGGLYAVAGALVILPGQSERTLKKTFAHQLLIPDLYAPDNHLIFGLIVQTNPETSPEVEALRSKLQQRFEAAARRLKKKIDVILDDSENS